MVKKYEGIKRNVFQYIQNRLAANIARETISNEIMNKYKLYVIFHNCSPEMIGEAVDMIIDQAIWIRTNYKHGMKNNSGE